MTQFLPPNLLALFAPRNPIPYFPPLDVLPWEKKPWPYSGIAQYVGEFESASETPPATRAETKEERVARKQQERKERGSASLKEQIEKWDVQSDPNVEGDPFKTLFVGRINFDTSESKLRREFEYFGRIKRIKMVMNSKTEKPRGYAFIEYEKERDMHTAYKSADGKKIDGKRVVVDVERGRTVKSWRPRRLGGGLGGTRRGGPNENIKYSGRIDERDLGDDKKGRDERKRTHSPDRRRRSRSKERSRKDRSRSKDRRDPERRNRDRSDRDKERDRSERDRDRSDRDKDRDRDRSDRDRDRDRSSRRDKERDRDKERSKDRHSRSDRKRDRDEADTDRGDDKRVKMESRSNGSENTTAKTES